MSLSVRRLAVVLVCHLLSGWALLASLALAGGLMVMERRQPLAMGVGVLVLLAWVCHLSMSLSWVLDRRMGRGVPGVGTLAALGSALSWPWVFPWDARSDAGELLAASGLGIVLALPSVLLALWLLRFHVRRPGRLAR
ncbi:hypothetical protein [Sphaerotilus uruguayifluvii]|uniref:Uncharacterized protein n=1 Tax=Sphaerotilus uruguayifluvii TaxID=2735897 RepID=A0ABX2G5A2_9BURK|nr:hypothetical protein [Leptothrix sp. C29]NRT57205.1 hypothetical protein [Leptothrix sp. C29]